ncbi:F-box protein At1g80960-like [Gastrolobium bilobum]|uniref:F-box protein At1g80960-like n=1 Tax=Gastrolobium bilobum TaxID=150636 RepID=UPI002AB1D265|nr:F-box protein At1g80960-like [Gastrolobium bilobum]
MSTNEGVDLISNLPDELLAAIISLLPGSEGVRTSILSRRWKSIWMHSSHLSFDQRQMLRPFIDLYLQTTSPYKRLKTALRRKVMPREEGDADAIGQAAMLINSILDTHSGPLTSCKIRHMDESCASGEAVGWMRKLLEQKGVRELSMERESPLNAFRIQNGQRRLEEHGMTLDLPFDIFSGFEVLQLKNYYLNTSPSVDVPQTLKTLTFIKVSLPPVDLQGILSNCSSLENLTLDSCGFRKEVKINCPSLKFFKICRMTVNEIVISAANLDVIEFDTIVSNPQRLDLKAPKLKVLRCYNDFKFERRYYSASGKKLLTSMELLEACRDIQSPQSSSIANVFENLVTLSIELDLNNVRNVISLSYYLRSCPHLQNLEINNKVRNESMDHYSSVFNDNGDDWLLFHKHFFWQRRVHFECINHQLKTICIRGYTGKKLEVEFVKCIITTAEKMERITICFVDDCSWAQATATLVRALKSGSQLENYTNGLYFHCNFMVLNIAIFNSNIC